MTIIEMVRRQIEQVGGDGLCCEGCWCGLDDLMPCEQANVTFDPCVVAKRRLLNDGIELDRKLIEENDLSPGDQWYSPMEITQRTNTGEIE